jgi:peptidoglycan hydrolase-like protein with peptidoglycan-binding domain
MATVAFILLSLCVTVWSMPLPFTNELTIGSSGDQVFIAQNLLTRVPNASPSVNGIFDDHTASAVRSLQSAIGLPVTGVLDAVSAQTLLVS